LRSEKLGSKVRSDKTESTDLHKSILIPFLSWFISGYDLSFDTLFANSLAKTYFPAPDFTYSLLAIFGVLSLSLLARFGGALALGRFGDKHQRKEVVIICLMLLTTVMFGSGLLAFFSNNNGHPNNIITSLFLLTRILVGFSIGGLWPTASVWGLENLAFDRVKTSEDSDKEHKYKDYIRKDLLPHGGAMQFGFHLGWFISALLFWLLTPSDLLTFGWLSVIGFLMSLVLLVFCWFKMDSSRMLEERIESLKKCKNMNKSDSEKTSESDSEKTSIGSIKILFKSHKDVLINLWLIMNGLFFLYYPSTVITTKVLTLGGLTPPLQFQILQNLLLSIIHKIPTLQNLLLPPIPTNILLLTIVLAAHGVPVVVYWKLRMWRNDRAIWFITRRYFHLYKLYCRIYTWTLSGRGLKHRINSKNQDDIKEVPEQNLDIIIIILTGFVLIGVVLIGFVLINAFKPIGQPWATVTPNDWGLLAYTSIVIFVGNTIWTLIPSLLSGSFPTELRNTASTLIYQGGLVIAFSSPFISMQFYLLVDQRYLLIIPIILGAVSIIIGGARMMSLQKSRHIKKNE